MNINKRSDKQIQTDFYIIGGFPARMVYLYSISCLRYTILLGNPRILASLFPARGKKPRTVWQLAHSGSVPFCAGAFCPLKVDV